MSRIQWSTDQLELDRKRRLRPSLGFTDEPGHRDLHGDGLQRKHYGYRCGQLATGRTWHVDLQLSDTSRSENQDTPRACEPQNLGGSIQVALRTITATAADGSGLTGNATLTCN